MTASHRTLETRVEDLTADKEQADFGEVWRDWLEGKHPSKMNTLAGATELMGRSRQRP